MTPPQPPHVIQVETTGRWAVATNPHPMGITRLNEDTRITQGVLADFADKETAERWAAEHHEWRVNLHTNT